LGKAGHLPEVKRSATPSAADPARRGLLNRRVKEVLTAKENKLASLLSRPKSTLEREVRPDTFNHQGKYYLPRRDLRGEKTTKGSELWGGGGDPKAK